MLTDERTGGDAVALWQRTVDLGDYISVTGEVATSRTGRTVDRGGHLDDGRQVPASRAR